MSKKTETPTSKDNFVPWMIGILVFLAILVFALDFMGSSHSTSVDHTTLSINEVVSDVGHALALVPTPTGARAPLGYLQAIDGYLYINPNNSKQTIKIALPHWDSELHISGSIAGSNRQYCLVARYFFGVPRAGLTPVTTVYNQRGIVSFNSYLKTPCFKGIAYNDKGIAVR